MNVTLQSQEEWKKFIRYSFYSPKTIFAHFNRLWMVVYTTIIKILFILKLYRMRIGVT